jgi:hypothetical protein
MHGDEVNAHLAKLFNKRKGIHMKLTTKIAIASALIVLAGAQSVAWARVASNIGHGTTCYNYPVTGPHGTVTFQRVCFKRA